MITTRDRILAKMLGCKPLEVVKLDSIVLPIDDYYDLVTDKTIEGFGNAVYIKALKYLKEFFEFAKYKYESNPHLYDGSVLNWDSELLSKAFEFLDPKKDLHFGFASDAFYMELDNWDLYLSVVQTINEDYNSGYSFNVLSEDFTTEFFGGTKTPKEYESLLI